VLQAYAAVGEGGTDVLSCGLLAQNKSVAEQAKADYLRHSASRICAQIFDGLCTSLRRRALTFP